MIQIVNCSVALLALLLAIFTILTRNVFAASFGFIAYGLLLTLVWVQLGAPDVALAEAAIGGGSPAYCWSAAPLGCARRKPTEALNAPVCPHDGSRPLRLPSSPPRLWCVCSPGQSLRLVSRRRPRQTWAPPVWAIRSLPSCSRSAR